MNAVEFVKNQISEFGFDAGWEKAKAHIDYLISYGSEFGHVSKEEVEELEHLVKSWELVEFIGYDLDGAKQVYEFSKDLKFLQMRGKIILIEDLRTAIRDMESVGGGV